MLPLPPPPPPPTPPSPPPSSPLLPQLPPPPARKQTSPASLKLNVKSKQAIYQQRPSTITKLTKPQTFRQPQPRRTNPLIWCCAILCLVFSLILIFFGIATLIIFLGIKPRNPVFDTPNASLNVIYFDSPEYFNGDFTFLANFSNPNKKIYVKFEYLYIELFFCDKMIATQALQPFTQKRGESRLESIHMISSLVYLPQNHAVELRKQVLSNMITYNIRGSFKVRATIGLIHYSYWLHTRCQLQMTGPPTGVLVAHSCRTHK
ncbi:LEA_2 domain-containing protein [Cephalotus follicularis]|uniref:LEA_2 domain-containing protein n=1 Tax=Cephalotus follicularis TaxID=3775 RepID=A0A1Q3AVG5_CEPFO|nr:LEA_2 domain-containing protein [Cephalotus follicularis]